MEQTAKELVTELLQTPVADMLAVMAGKLRASPADLKLNHYLYLPAAKPDGVLLVAHVDTVWEGPRLPVWNGNLATHPEGLGADDRAGVAAIVALHRMGLPPDVGILFTDQEEVGGVGVGAFIQDNDALPYRALIEIDRRGDVELAFYGGSTSERWEGWALEAFGPAWGFGFGTYTDVADLGRAYGIPAVNVAAGYMFEHTHREVFSLDAWQRSVDALYRVLWAHSGTWPQIPVDIVEESDGDTMDADDARALQNWWENFAGAEYHARNEDPAADLNDYTDRVQVLDSDGTFVGYVDDIPEDWVDYQNFQPYVMLSDLPVEWLEDLYDVPEAKEVA